MNYKQLLAVAAAGMVATAAEASLSLSYQFNGLGNWTLDGVGSNSTPVGQLSISVPNGSTVEKAFLYSSGTPNSSVNSVDFDGTVLTSGDFTALGSTTFGSQAFRADVTSLVSSKVGSGGGAFSFDIFSESPNSGLDGEVLAVVYSNPAESLRTIAFLDGASDTDGDSFSFSTANPMDPSVSGFEALLSLGIGYGFQPSATTNTQYSQVDVNGRLLTTSAGGYDDGGGFNGGLITVGGEGDSPTNPDITLTGGDDELYNLALGNSADSSPFIANGDTLITVDTLNPSDDDNIFFAGFNITAEGNVTPTGPIVPEPSTVGLIGVGALIGFAAIRRRSKARKAQVTA